VPELEDVEKDAIATLPRKFKVNVKSHNKIRVGPVSWARCRKTAIRRWVLKPYQPSGDHWGYGIDISNQTRLVALMERIARLENECNRLLF
jgi:hypothetical protein